MKEREKLIALPLPEKVSRDSHVTLSRDVTQENRQDKKREEKTTTTDQVRLLLANTPLVKIKDRELLGLEKRHGPDRLLQAADIAAETWRRTREEKHNPGGYLNAVCSSLVVPDWYVPCSERAEIVEKSKRRQEDCATEQAALEARELEETRKRDELWEALSAERREHYRSKALAGLPAALELPENIKEILARALAWEEAQSVADD